MRPKIGGHPAPLWLFMFQLGALGVLAVNELLVGRIFRA
jgi:hypothetical protein